MVALHDPIDASVREALRAHDDLIASLLARRGITTQEEAEAFLNPSYDAHLGDPMQILNMPRATWRIAQALDSGERITVWSDYDCDGIPGGVILHDFLKKAGANFTNYIPHRHIEGYGVNVIGIEQLAKEGTTLVITVDSGITDVEAIARAKELGIDVILTDHHLPGEILPDAYAVIDPKQDGETNTFREFCGAGLAWKLVCAVLAHGFKTREQIPRGWEKWLLDMAGLATIADMVPLRGENRIIASYGLLVMRKSPRPGLQALCKEARVRQMSITEDDVGFMIAPRVNAASRMGNPRDAFELFTTEDPMRASVLAKELEKANRARRAQAAATTRAVHTRIKERLFNGPLPDVIVMGDPDWRPGLLGLVANSIAEEFERPVFLWGREGGLSLKGSCRAGLPQVDVVALMQGAVEALEGYGGHRASGGFTVHADKVSHLERLLNEAYRVQVQDTGESISVRADMTLPLAEATNQLLNRVSRLAPFGMGNEKPSFAFHDVEVVRIAWFGKAEEHLKLTLSSDGFDQIEGVTFYAKRSLGKKVQTLVAGTRVSVVGNLEREQFVRGRPVRLRLLAIY